MESGIKVGGASGRDRRACTFIIAESPPKAPPTFTVHKPSTGTRNPEPETRNPERHERQRVPSPEPRTQERTFLTNRLLWRALFAFDLRIENPVKAVLPLQLKHYAPVWNSRILNGSRGLSTDSWEASPHGTRVNRPGWKLPVVRTSRNVATEFSVSSGSPARRHLDFGSQRHTHRQTTPKRKPTTC